MPALRQKSPTVSPLARSRSASRSSRSICSLVRRFPMAPSLGLCDDYHIPWTNFRGADHTSLAECSYHFYFDKPTNDLSSKQANFNGNYPFGKAPKGPHLARPTRVGAYPSNKLGLCDMHGN